MTKKLRGHQSASKRASYKWEGSDKVTTSVAKLLGNTMDNEKSVKKRIYNKRLYAYTCAYSSVPNRRAGRNKRAGGIFFSKSINVQTKIRPCRVDFFLKINKRACTSIRYTRVLLNNTSYCYGLYRSHFNCTKATPQIITMSKKTPNA